MQHDAWGNEFELCVCAFSLLFLQFKRFHRDVIIELEKKTEMDVKYMNVSASISATRP